LIGGNGDVGLSATSGEEQVGRLAVGCRFARTLSPVGKYRDDLDCISAMRSGDVMAMMVWTCEAIWDVKSCQCQLLVVNLSCWVVP
jgi:hypothetical protein